MLIINAKILTMEKKNYDNGFIHILDGKIAAIGDMNDINVEDKHIINAENKTVLPGLIDAHTHLGMWENGIGFEGDDGNEDTDPITPQLRAIDAINPMDYCFEEALQAGVTTVLTGPGSANPISGIWCAMKTKGKRIDDMLVSDYVGMKFALGENPKTVYNGKNQTPVTRMATASLIREELKKTERYIQDIKKAKKDDDTDAPEVDVKCEALMPVLKRKVKAFFHAHRADDIFTAIRIAKEFKLDLVIVHGTEGYKISKEIKAENIPVITGPLLCDRSKPEIRDLDTKNPAVLCKAGVKTAICTDHPVIPIQYLNISAAIAVKAGLDYYEALKMLTIIPAQICGIDKKVGSLKVGKDADILIVDGDVLSVYTSPETVIINGEII